MAYNNLELAKTSTVKVALTVDGADLFKGRTHISIGIKITDELAAYPITKQPIIVVNTKSNEDDMSANM
jgi:hypothetical protein